MLPCPGRGAGGETPTRARRPPGARGRSRRRGRALLSTWSPPISLGSKAPSRLPPGQRPEGVRARNSPRPEVTWPALVAQGHAVRKTVGARVDGSDGREELG